jgi:hypothetical protein
VHDLSAEELTPRRPRHGAENVMRKRTALLAVVAALALGGLVSASTLLPEPPVSDTKSHPVWREVRWPFPMDQWGKGTSFQCSAADCGTEISIYLRAKIGFCNCTTGMTDDADLDRVGDFDLFGGALYPQAAGQPVKVAWMKGRSRPFAIRDTRRDDATILTIGLHDSCDALVATAVLERGQLPAAEPLVMRFLNSKTVADWAEITLGF